MDSILVLVLGLLGGLAGFVFLFMILPRWVGRLINSYEEAKYKHKRDNPIETTRPGPPL